MKELREVAMMKAIVDHASLLTLTCANKQGLSGPLVPGHTSWWKFIESFLKT